MKMSRQILRKWQLVVDSCREIDPPGYSHPANVEDMGTVSLSYCFALSFPCGRFEPQGTPLLNHNRSILDTSKKQNPRFLIFNRILTSNLFTKQFPMKFATRVPRSCSFNLAPR